MFLAIQLQDIILLYGIIGIIFSAYCTIKALKDPGNQLTLSEARVAVGFEKFKMCLMIFIVTFIQFIKYAITWLYYVIKYLIDYITLLINSREN